MSPQSRHLITKSKLNIAKPHTTRLIFEGVSTTSTGKQCCQLKIARVLLYDYWYGEACKSSGRSLAGLSAKRALGLQQLTAERVASKQHGNHLSDRTDSEQSGLVLRGWVEFTIRFDWFLLCGRQMEPRVSTECKAATEWGITGHWRLLKQQHQPHHRHHLPQLSS